MSVSVNSPKTPVTAGSMGIAAATVPNVCKMPGPPAPFVPVPLPNIGKSDDSPDGYSKSVTIESNAVAIAGATFNSIGDIASKGTGGGLISSNTHGITKFVGPGALDVQIEGKNVQLLSDPMLNNCAAGGSPPNAATLMGVIQRCGLVLVVEGGKCPRCGKQHEDFAESGQSQLNARHLADKFDEHLHAADATSHTMLGVVRCKCEKIYADQSGQTTVELCKAADDLGYNHRETDKKSHPSEPPKPQNIDDWLKHNLPDKADDIRATAFGRFKNSRDNKNTASPSPAAYPLGKCAAQKTLLLLLNDDALPDTMTERWFASDHRPMKNAVTFIDRSARAKTKEPTSRTFEHGKSVPPCDTCNLILPWMLCPQDQDKCTHKT